MTKQKNLGIERKLLKLYIKSIPNIILNYERLNTFSLRLLKRQKCQRYLLSPSYLTYY
jgi:hypothetical protein